MSGSVFGTKSTSSLVHDDDETMTWAGSSSASSSSLHKSFRSNTKKKADYIPSGYIQQQLALEEEARRREEGEASSRTSSTDKDWPKIAFGRGSKKLGAEAPWPSADQVLTQKFSSGQLGYEVPTEGADVATLRRAEMEAEAAAASRTSVYFASDSTGAGASTETAPGAKSPRLYVDLRTSASNLSNTGRGDSMPGSPITTMKPAFQKDVNAEETLRRRSSVRFADVDSARSASSNTTDADKDSIDILTRSIELGHEKLNSSLGPALGAVGGRQSISTGWSLTDSDKLGTGSGTGSKQGARAAENRPNSIFPEKEDLLQRQQEVALAEQANKERQSRNKKGDDEEDNKDTPHYLPGYLLDSFSGTKATKVEPFVDEQTDLEWTKYGDPLINTEAQSTIRPPLMNEDVPPSETLDTLARKEGLYTRPIPTFSNAQSFLQDTRMDDVQMNEAPAPLPQSIIIYGFPPEASSHMLNQFRSFGAVTFYKTGYYVLKGSSVNWMKIRYQDQSGVKRAVANHLKTLGGFRVGVSLCPSFDSFVETHGPVLESEDDSNLMDCTVEEQQSIEAGLNALNAIQRSEIPSVTTGGHDQFGSQLRPAPTLHHPRPMDASWAPQQSQFRQSASQYYNPTQPTSSFRHDDDEDFRAILGHSITSGSLLGSRRAASADGFHPSHSGRHSFMGNAQDHSAFKSSQAGADSFMSSGTSRTSSPADSGVSMRMHTDSPTGFQPLFKQPSSSLSSNSMLPSTSAPATATAASTTSPQDQPSSSAPSWLSPTQPAAQVQPQVFSTEPLMRRTYNQSMLGSSPLRTSMLSRSHSTGSGVVRAGEDLQGMHAQKRARLSSSFAAPAGTSAQPFGASRGVRSPSFRSPQERSKFLADGDAEEKRQEQLRQQQQQQQNGGGGSVWSSIVDMAKRNLFWG
ncbi:hypothetical protein BGW41_005600 [Actinomortierella wolfii]|nr:hypothetical protein BGW41_005600 [Actinomortierella wolfii]